MFWALRAFNYAQYEPAKPSGATKRVKTRYSGNLRNLVVKWRILAQHLKNTLQLIQINIKSDSKDLLTPKF